MATNGEFVTERTPGTYESFPGAYMEMHDGDEPRLRALQAAIMGSEGGEGGVRPGDVVLELGGGRGWLSVFAAQAGARKVYCVERDPGSLNAARMLAAENGLTDRIEFVEADALTYMCPEPVDTLICEIFSNGFFYEPQIQAVLAGRRSLKPSGRVIPEAVATGIELIVAQTEFLGMQLPKKTRWRHLEGDEPLTDRAWYNWTELGKVTAKNMHIAGAVALTARVDGTVNAVRISPDIWVRLPESEGGWSVRHNTPSPTWGNPDIVFLTEPFDVDAGQIYMANIRYEAGDFPDDAQIRLSAVSETINPTEVNDAVPRSMPATIRHLYGIDEKHRKM